jgi:hypothetical protein
VKVGTRTRAQAIMILDVSASASASERYSGLAWIATQIVHLADEDEIQLVVVRRGVAGGDTDPRAALERAIRDCGDTVTGRAREFWRKDVI